MINSNIKWVSRGWSLSHVIALEMEHHIKTVNVRPFVSLCPGAAISPVTLLYLPLFGQALGTLFDKSQIFWFTWKCTFTKLYAVEGCNEDSMTANTLEVLNEINATSSVQCKASKVKSEHWVYYQSTNAYYKTVLYLFLSEK